MILLYVFAGFTAGYVADQNRWSTAIVLLVALGLLRVLENSDWT